VLNGLTMELEADDRPSSPNGLDPNSDNERLGFLDRERAQVALFRVRLREAIVFLEERVSSCDSTGLVQGRNRERRNGAPEIGEEDGGRTLSL
jgi:hypothetical protein